MFAARKSATFVITYGTVRGRILHISTVLVSSYVLVQPLNFNFRSSPTTQILFLKPQAGKVTCKMQTWLFFDESSRPIIIRFSVRPSAFDTYFHSVRCKKKIKNSTLHIKSHRATGISFRYLLNLPCTMHAKILSIRDKER